MASDGRKHLMIAAEMMVARQKTFDVGAAEVDDGGAAEKMVHVLYAGHIPLREVTVKRFRAAETCTHIFTLDTSHLDTSHFEMSVLKRFCSHEHVIHRVHAVHIPLRDVASRYTRMVV